MNNNLNRKDYEDDLKKRREEHFKNINRNFGINDENWQPCMHDQCPECLGTGIKKNGGMCVHMLSCSCPKCSPRC